MNIEELRDCCLSLPNVEECLPFDNNTPVYKIGGKMFAFFGLEYAENEQFVNLKGEQEKSITLREEYEGIQPAYHMNKSHWNSVFLQRDVPDRLIKELISDSYSLVFNKLTKQIKQTLL
ncbi:MAG: MmcQ/YjbR family DNA-binding protein [Prevotellaceae bacterium]|jgi:predicted DNA-binding protein (MmcQ/YjbR family)|nr:MmcQ/YjbR family DNA-binding protein [Prevotellaceae bacterium]